MSILICQCCNQPSPRLVKIPGPRLGNSYFEQNVCDECSVSHKDNIEKEFWLEAADKNPSLCGKCGADLRGKDHRHAHRRMKADGTWELSNVCVPCFEKFAEHRNKTKK